MPKGMGVQVPPRAGTEIRSEMHLNCTETLWMNSHHASLPVAIDFGDVVALMAAVGVGVSSDRFKVVRAGLAVAHHSACDAAMAEGMDDNVVARWIDHSG